MEHKIFLCRFLTFKHGESLKIENNVEYGGRMNEFHNYLETMSTSVRLPNRMNGGVPLQISISVETLFF